LRSVLEFGAIKGDSELRIRLVLSVTFGACKMSDDLRVLRNGEFPLRQDGLYNFGYDRITYFGFFRID
jgi:hypothetical protein